MDIVRCPLDTIEANASRTWKFTDALEKLISNHQNPLEIFETAYEIYSALAKKVDVVLSKANDTEFLADYANRIRACNKWLNELETYIATLKNGGRIPMDKAIAYVGLLEGELTGMNFTVELHQ